MARSLLEQLQESLNKIYDGNTIIGDNDGVPHKDSYKCDCGLIVPIEEWSEESKICVDCYVGHTIDIV